MFSVRYALLSGAALAALTSQVNAQPRPTGGIVGTVETRVATYHAGVAGFTPAASATDFMTLTGSATNVVRVKEVECTGISTANGNIAVRLVRRTTANTGGTLVAMPAYTSDTADAAASATAGYYTANAATLGTLVANSMFRIGLLSTVVAASATVETTPMFGWQFGQYQNDKEITLRGVAQVLALNANATSFPAGAAISCDIEWTETPL